MRLRIKPGIAMVRIKDPRDGKLHDFYGEQTVLPEWCCHDEEQMTRFRQLNLVELCDESGHPLDADRAWECVSALIAVGLPEDAGAPRAREMLRMNGLQYSNDTICKAIALRKSGAKYEAPQ